MPPRTAPEALARDLLARGRPLALLLDYDGTLVPIAPTPPDARLGPALRQRLERLAQRSDLRIALVTGRALEGLEEVGGRIPGLALAVNGGLRIVDGARDWVQPDAARSRPVIAAVRRELEALHQRWPGSIIEDKGLSLTFHFRLCPAAHDQVVQVADELLRRHPGSLRRIEGKQSVELQPAVAWDKGRACLALLEHWAIPPERAIFLGDDRIDEPAFVLVGEHGGLTCRVGAADADSQAAWSLPDVESAAKFLEALDS